MTAALDQRRHSPSARDICLVNMPYAALPRPSLALGLLKGILAEAGLAADVLYLNLEFAERIGLRRYHVCSAQMPTELLVGEWTFAAAAFPGADLDGDGYLERLAISNLGATPRATRLAEVLPELRAAAAEFVDDAAQRIVASGARIVGCTSTFEQHTASLALLRRIHELDPETITMLGGANCETEMGAATHRCFPWVDYVVSGEADGIIARLCRDVLARGRDIPASDLPPGVLGPRNRDLTGSRPERPTPRALFRDLDSLATPLYEDYFDALDSSTLAASITPALPLETSRGCWWGARHHCTFCGLNGSSMAFRSKSPERVLTELRTLEDRYGISSFEVVDNILDTAYLKSVVPQLAEDSTRRRIFYEVKANLTRAHVELLVRAGISWVQPGIESLHSDVLRLMDKGVQGWQNVQLMKWSRQFGLRLSWAILWGFPGEQDDWYVQMAEWLPALEHLHPPSSLTRLRYDRYSVYHQQARELSLDLRPVPAMAYVYPAASKDLADLAYFFVAHERSTLDRWSDEDAWTARPGADATRSAVQAWRERWLGGLPPVLAMRDVDGGLEIIDTRRIAVATRRTLTGLARAVCLACDVAPVPDRLAAAVRREHELDFDEDELEHTLAQLVAEGLVMRIDGRLMALPVSGSIPTLSDASEFPGGYVSETAGARPAPAEAVA